MRNANFVARSDFQKRQLVKTTTVSQITAPAGFLDLTDWLFHVPEWDYNACTPPSNAHLSAAFTLAPDGTRMSINVEDIGGALIVEHYREDICEKLHCRVVSISDLLIEREYTTAEVTWEIIAEPTRGDLHDFIVNIEVFTTAEYDAYLEKHGKTFEEARDAFQKAIEEHSAEETPNFAASIQRRALRTTAA